MPRRILSATDYGFRKVFRVLMDDALPEWVHPIDGGAAHTAATARDANGALDPSLRPGTECHSCVFNRDVREYTFTREELQIEAPPDSGVFRNKTDAELVVEIQLRLLPVPPPVPIGAVTNQII